MSTNAKPYKETLNLPATRFDMKANLTVREPQIQARWREQEIYAKVRQARAGAPRKVLHDGPPYANGDIHLAPPPHNTLHDPLAPPPPPSRFASPHAPRPPSP